MPDFILDTLDFLAYMKAIFLLTWKLDTLTVEGAAWYTKNNNWVPPCGIFDSGSRACRAIHIRRRGTPCQLKGHFGPGRDQHETPVTEIDHRSGVNIWERMGVPTVTYWAESFALCDCFKFNLWLLLCMIAMIALVFWFLDLNNHVSIYEYKHVYNIFANMYILLVLENT